MTAHPRIGRRRLLQLTAGAGALGATSLTGCSGSASYSAASAVGAVDFTQPLPIPPLAESTEHDGYRTFELVAQEGTSRIVPQGDTDTWGLNGTILGPTLRVRRGEAIRIDVRNELPEATSIHWHGMRLPAEADGGPHQPIEPGETWSPSWTVDQPAATLWYHPHPHGETERHVYRGLGGFFLIDEHDPSLALPHTYGVDDIPLVVQDKTFDDAGQLVETARHDVGMLGDTILVNGAAGAVLDVTRALTRLRLLNGSTARSYSFGFSDDRSFAMVASDGGPLENTATLTRILLSPGERAEIVVAMDPDEEVTLRSYPHNLGISSRRTERAGADDELDILLLRAASSLGDSPEIPPTLVSIPRLEAAEAATTRVFELGNNLINGKSMDMSRIDAEILVDTVEIWEIINTHTQPHNFHIHDVQFQILAIGGDAPPPELSGWKDTVYTPPGVRLRLIMRFGPHTDPHMPYMFHCHLLWHEDQGMMGQFTVLPPHE